MRVIRCYRCNRNGKAETEIVVTSVLRGGAFVTCKECGHTWAASKGFEGLPGYDKAFAEFQARENKSQPRYYRD